MKDDDITRPDNVVLGLSLLLGQLIGIRQKEGARIAENAIAEIERLRAVNAALLAEIERLRDANAVMLAACEAFVGYYDQAGIGDCSEADEEARDRREMDDNFDGDETMNVRMGRAAIALATGQEVTR